ncbi:DUF4189 domain-containing protein [Xanthomonas sp. LMG 12461]|uniref:DUF4189 domain-containing protein n=1 Tax=Xanthomonas sp. LMG 12461 TaxID=2014543 RepID=UPI0012655B1F|nr:DUF4189 domain-containing protein [Xanthomonas sp. LMG 12461]KAB7761925.1 hypothetical protein CEK68_20235 [Xanthomonas sp. LMG 12461]
MKISLLFTMLLLANTADAENGCPPGQLPAQANGAITSCTPIPQGYYQAQPAPPPQPSGRWINTWGAIAIGSVDATTDYGVTTGKLSQAEAEADALKRCGKHGATNCEIAFKYHNQCAAIAEPQTNGLPIVAGRVQFVGAGSTAEASRIAQEDCKKANKMTPSLDCKVIYKACTEQIFEKF